MNVLWENSILARVPVIQHSPVGKEEVLQALGIRITRCREPHLFTGGALSWRGVDCFGNQSVITSHTDAQ